MGVVVCRYSSNIWQASIANFDSVSVNYSMEWVAFGEILVHQREKFLPYISLDIQAMGRIEPDDFPGSGPLQLWNFLFPHPD